MRTPRKQPSTAAKATFLTSATRSRITSGTTVSNPVNLIEDSDVEEMKTAATSDTVEEVHNLATGKSSSDPVCLDG